MVNRAPLILFDLDNTLFDHNHSLTTALSVVQESCPPLRTISLDHLVGAYNCALDNTYLSYLDGWLSYQETHSRRVITFFHLLGQPTPTPEEIRRFRDIYQPAYRNSRRPTPGSIEALTRLQERGYRLAIVTNGQTDEQEAKAKAIGLEHLVDRIFTSQEVGHRKPHPLMFRFAVQAMGGSAETTIMVGDSLEADIMGALGVGIHAIHYQRDDGGADETGITSGVQALQGVAVLDHMANLPTNEGVRELGKLVVRVGQPRVISRKSVREM